jgi:hypothetical protein
MTEALSGSESIGSTFTVARHWSQMMTESLTPTDALQRGHSKHLIEFMTGTDVLTGPLIAHPVAHVTILTERLQGADSRQARMVKHLAESLALGLLVPPYVLQHSGPHIDPGHVFVTGTLRDTAGTPLTGKLSVDNFYPFKLGSRIIRGGTTVMYLRAGSLYLDEAALFPGFLPPTPPGRYLKFDFQPPTGPRVYLGATGIPAGGPVNLGALLVAALSIA